MPWLWPQPTAGASLLEGPMEVVEALRGLRARHCLVKAAREGCITEMACEMPECVCPDGRRHFEPVGVASPWAPSADRWPLAGRDGGGYVTGNVRLAHARCNKRAGTYITIEHRKSSGQYLSEAHRANGRRLHLAGVEGRRAFYQTDRSREMYSAIAKRMVEWRKDPANYAKWLAATRERPTSPVVIAALADYSRSPEGRAKSVEMGKVNGRRSACLRWNVRRGKACVCGHH